MFATLLTVALLAWTIRATMASLFMESARVAAGHGVRGHRGVAAAAAAAWARANGGRATGLSSHAGGAAVEEPVQSLPVGKAGCVGGGGEGVVDLLAWPPVLGERAAEPAGPPDRVPAAAQQLASGPAANGGGDAAATPERGSGLEVSAGAGEQESNGGVVLCVVHCGADTTMDSQSRAGGAVAVTVVEVGASSPGADVPHSHRGMGAPGGLPGAGAAARSGGVGGSFSSGSSGSGGSAGRPLEGPVSKGGGSRAGGDAGHAIGEDLDLMVHDTPIKIFVSYLQVSVAVDEV